MRFQTEVWEQYAASQNRAKRILRKDKDMKLPVLNDILDRSKMTDIVELGTVNIPVCGSMKNNSRFSQILVIEHVLSCDITRFF